jgi:hypothetical protein
MVNPVRVHRWRALGDVAAWAGAAFVQASGVPAKPGSFEFSCNMIGHPEVGMKGPIEVS